MLFQLVINVVVLIILVQVFHLCTLYLPLTQKLAEHIAWFSQAIVSCTQMSCYIVYVPLLLRMANDVEENPGPTVYDVLAQVKQSLLTLTRAIRNFDEMLVNNV